MRFVILLIFLCLCYLGLLPGSVNADCPLNVGKREWVTNVSYFLATVQNKFMSCLPTANYLMPRNTIELLRNEQLLVQQLIGVPAM